MDRRDPAQIYGVLGNPAKHSLSPLMHNAAFQALKINAHYVIFEKKSEELEYFFSSLSRQRIFGLNVTLPYKEKVIAFLDTISKEAKLIGAVNTIKRTPRMLLGLNTDGEGFLRHLNEDLQFEPKDKVIALLGAGGAAKAISVYLGKQGPKKICAYDIDATKLSALEACLKKNFKGINFVQADTIEGLCINECDLLINATPVGMKESDPCIIDGKFMHRGLLVYDLIYNPPETKLLALAKKLGAKTANGLGMLLYQGALSFEYFTGRGAPIEIMRRALNEGVKRL